MSSLAKTKDKTSLSKKQNTWSNLLNKKSAGTNTEVASKNKSKNESPVSERNTKTMSKNIQCDSSNDKSCQSSTTLSVFNPVRTLQFLLKEIKELPNVKIDTDITKIIGEMQWVVGRIVNDFSEKVSYSELQMTVENDISMIPTREDNYCKDLKYENNPPENKYWIMLLGKISELENNYSRLTKNYTKSEEKLLCVTSERDKLLEKFKESCDSLEKMNNREREYIDTITELKSKLVATEKLISKQEVIITSLNKKFSHLPIDENQVEEFLNEKMSAEQHNNNIALYNAILKENNEFKKNHGITKLNLDKSKIVNNFKDNSVPMLRSDTKQIKQIVLTEFEDTDIKSVSTASLKSNLNPVKDFSKYSEDNNKDVEHDIDMQFTEYNRQASAIKLVKTELQQLFEKIITQTNLSEKMFNSTMVESDISDEEDNYSNVSNFMSVITDSSC